MSYGATYSAADPDFNQRGPGMNAFNMFAVGWLDDLRVWRSQLESYDEIVVLRPLMRYDLEGQLAANLGDIVWAAPPPYGVFGNYLVEFRIREGWDAAIPSSTVLIHRLSPTQGVSYLMPNTSGLSWPNPQAYNLGTGDIFYMGGPFTPGPGVSRSRVQVLGIDEAGMTATIRISYTSRLPTLTSLVPRLSGPGFNQLFGIGKDGRAWQITQAGFLLHDFGPTWFVLGRAQNLVDITVGINANGYLDVFALDPNPGVWHIWQTNPNTGEWSGGDWQPIWGVDLQSIEVVSNQDGRLELFGLGKDGKMYHTWQTLPNYDWSDWSQLGDAAGLRQFTVGRNADGRLEVFALDPNPGVWHVWQTNPNGGAGYNNWSGWQPIWGASFGLQGQLMVANNTDGSLELFGLDNNPCAWHSWKDLITGEWSDWVPIFGI